MKSTILVKPAVAQRTYQFSSESFRRFSSESCGRMDRQTHMASPMCVHFMLIVQWTQNNDPRNLLTAKVTQCRYVTDLVGAWRHCWLPSLYEHWQAWPINHCSRCYWILSSTKLGRCPRQTALFIWPHTRLQFVVCILDCTQVCLRFAVAVRSAYCVW
jgi:hypothetical protein